MDILYLGNIQVNFWHILPETSKSSAFWDMGVNFHLKWLLLFSPYKAGEWGRHQSMHPVSLERAVSHPPVTACWTQVPHDYTSTHP